MYKLLLVEDDPALANGLVAGLQLEGYEVLHINDGLTAYKRAQHEKFDLIILDLTLPGKNGEDVCRDLRKQGIGIPILMLTSKNRVEEKVEGFNLGADDYVTKPFDMTELSARIKALLRRPVEFKPALETVVFGDILVDFKTQTLSKASVPLKTSFKEFEILKYFLEHEGEVVTRDDLLNNIWGYEAFPTPRTIDNFILSLRKKLEIDPSEPLHILSLYGTGYKFVK